MILILFVVTALAVCCWLANPRAYLRVPELLPTSVRGGALDETILEEAERLVTGDRRDGYGHPLDNHTTTGRMFAAYLERKYGVAVPVDADDVCWFNVFQKASRDANEPARDNLVDGAGYLRNVEMVRDERDLRPPIGMGSTGPSAD